jgi:O-antigen/teichoic acid export membrane protein
MTKKQTAYRQIMKATTIFGGVQIFQIIIQIIRTKFIAVLLGPAGMGIAGLLNSTIGLIRGATNFGLGISAVKNIAAANSTGNEIRIAIVAKVLQRLVWITGLLGTLTTLVLSPWLSQLTFGNKEYTLAFIWISITLLFTQLSSGQLVILQGIRKLQYLAKANLSGSVLGLLITVPLYYKLGIDGIVPGIIITSIIALSFSWFFARKIALKPVNFSREEAFIESKDMLSMGFMISLSSFIALGTSYVVRIFISRFGGVEQVGLFTAGFAIINTYVGMIFTAMSTDYFPRLSEVAANNKLSKQIINQQAEIALLILAPIIIILLVFLNWVIVIILSAKFQAVNQMIYWAALGVFFKAASWAIAFIFLAKGSSKLFFWNELIASIYLLALNLLGYYLMGLTGLGISFAVGYLLYSIQVYLISKIKYEFSFDMAFLKIFGVQFTLAIWGFLSVNYLINPYKYVLGVILIGISIWYSYKELNARIGIYALLNKFRK